MRNKSRLILIIDDSNELTKDKIPNFKPNYPILKNYENFVERNKEYQNKLTCSSKNNDLIRHYKTLNRKY